MDSQVMTFGRIDSLRGSILSLSGFQEWKAHGLPGRITKNAFGLDYNLS